jgi:cobalt-zinc-cadmium efflux system protein
MHRSHDAANGRGPGGAFPWVIALNSFYVLIEALFGFWIGSLALLADAAHNLTDVLGLILAWGAIALARLRPNERHT